MDERLDANKTPLTHVATATAAAWLRTAGVKPVETEVRIADGWTADLAGAWCPTITEAKAARLIERAACWKDAKCDLEKLYRQVGGVLTVAVEVKVSRGDFRADVGRKYATITSKLRTELEPAAHFCVLAAPKSVLGDDQLHRWCHLVLSDDCSRVLRLEGWAHANPLHAIQIQRFLYQVAVRCEHRTSYQRMRAWIKSYRAERKSRGTYAGFSCPSPISAPKGGETTDTKGE